MVGLARAGLPDLFRAIVLFIAFGLLMALAWVRLDAPDVALAEAAIGAGLTGALLLGALARLRSAEAKDEVAGQPENEGPKVRHPQWLPVFVLLRCCRARLCGLVVTA